MRKLQYIRDIFKSKNNLDYIKPNIAEKTICKAGLDKLIIAAVHFS